MQKTILDEALSIVNYLVDVHGTPLDIAIAAATARYPVPAIVLKSAYSGQTNG